MITAVQRDRWRRAWDRQARIYDRQMGLMDRWLFKDSRAWACGQARGQVLEVAVGTGLNLEHYSPEVTVTGIDVSPAMLAKAKERRVELDRRADLRVGDAEALDVPDGSMDTVVCTFSLCAIPDHRRALREMARVLRPGGRLILADHVASTSPLIRAGQRLFEIASVPLAGEHFTRRPHDLLDSGLTIEQHDRFTFGIVERLVARKPADSTGSDAEAHGTTI